MSANYNPLEDLREIVKGMKNDVGLLEMKKESSIDYARDCFNDGDYQGASMELGDVVIIESLHRDCKRLEEILKPDNKQLKLDL